MDISFAINTEREATKLCLSDTVAHAWNRADMLLVQEIERRAGFLAAIAESMDIDTLTDYA